MERQQQDVEQELDEHNGRDEDEGQQQEVNDVAAVETGLKGGNTHLSSKEERGPRSAERQQLLPNCDPSVEPSQDEADSDSHSSSFQRFSAACYCPDFWPFPSNAREIVQ